MERTGRHTLNTAGAVEIVSSARSSTVVTTVDALAQCVDLIDRQRFEAPAISGNVLLLSLAHESFSLPITQCSQDRSDLAIRKSVSHSVSFLNSAIVQDFPQVSIDLHSASTIDQN